MEKGLKTIFISHETLETHRIDFENLKIKL